MTILCSFTFFASAVEPRLGRLQLRLKTAEQTIIKLGADLSSAFSKEVARAVVANTNEAAPELVKAGLNRVDVVYEKEKRLQISHAVPPPPIRIDPGWLGDVLSRRSRISETLAHLVRPAESPQPAWFGFPPDEVRSLLARLSSAKLNAYSEELHDKPKETNQALAEVEDTQRKLTEKVIHGIIELGVGSAQIPLLEAPLIEPFIAVIKAAMGKLGGERVGAYLHQVVAALQSGILVKDALHDVAQRFVKDKAQVQEAWQKYLRDHPGKLQQEQNKLEQWENRVEAARLNHEARERWRNAEQRKIKVNTEQNFGAEEIGANPLGKYLPEKQTGRRRLNDVEGDLNTSKRPNEGSYGRGLEIKPRPPRPKGPRK